MAISKVVYGNEVLLDLTADTVTPDKLAQGITAHNMAGELITGENTYDSDTSDATVAVAEMLEGKTAYARGKKITGTMPNNGAVSGKISSKTGAYSIPLGFHDGSGTVAIDSTEQAKLIPENIREGVTVLGVVGTMSGSEAETPQDDKVVTPSKLTQTITPDEGYTCLRQVTVNPIPYVEAPNAAGGTTVTIG